MSKKTNDEIYRAAREKWDKANSPYQAEATFERFYEEARLEWMKLKVKDFERTEAVRTNLLPFLRKHAYGDSKKLVLSEVLPDRIFHRSKLTGDYEFECNGTVTTRNLNIEPRTLDSDIALDPFNQPDDTEPMYYDENDGTGPYIQILSQSVPKNVVLRYVKYPEPFLLLDNPEGTTEEGEAEQNEIIDMAVEKYFAKIGDAQGFQIQQNEVANKGT